MMSSIWFGLIREAQGRATRSEWTRLKGSEVWDFQRWLELAPDLATNYTYRHPQSGKTTFLNVAEIATDEFVGYDDSCEIEVKLSRDDLLVYRPSLSRLLPEIGKLFGCIGIPMQINSEPPIWKVGEFKIARTNIHVFFALGRTDFETKNAARYLNAERSQFSLTEPFVTVLPYYSDRTPNSLNGFLSNNGSVVDLSRATELTMKGLDWTSVGKTWLTEFRRRFPTPEEMSTQPFVVPAGTHWKDITLRKVDGHTFSISVLNHTFRATYQDMSMQKSTSKKPDVQWKLLQLFAQSWGRLAPREIPNEKQRTRLARQLREYFRLTNDPFVFQDGQWITKFTIKET